MFLRFFSLDSILALHSSVTTEYCCGQSRLNYADFDMPLWFHCPYSIAFQTGNQIKYQGLLQSVSIHTNDKAASMSCYLFILQGWGPNLGPHKASAFCVKLYLMAMWVHWITQWSKYRSSDEEDKLWARNPCASRGFTFFSTGCQSILGQTAMWP